jgi:hypothetical protein
VSTKKKTSLPLEKVTRERIASFFRSSGYVVQEEVRNPFGVADILIREYKPNGEVVHHLVEVKRKNDSHSLKFAVSQLNMYRKHYGSNTKLYFCTSDKSKLSEESKRIMQANPDILYKVF